MNYIEFKEKLSFLLQKPEYKEIGTLIESFVQEHNITDGFDIGEDYASVLSIKGEENNGYRDSLYLKIDKVSETIYITTISDSYHPTGRPLDDDKFKLELEMFTKSSSKVFDKVGKLLYSSSNADDIKSIKLLEGQTGLAISEQCNPKYQFGRQISKPTIAHSPFNNVWFRYPGTNVYSSKGISPIRGEFSTIGIAMDNPSMDNIEVVQESYGQLFYANRRIDLSEEQIVEVLESLYHKLKIDYKMEEIDSVMQPFISRVY